MVNDLYKLTNALRRNTPEQLLVNSLKSNKELIISILKSGKEFTMRDVCGRLIKIVPGSFNG